MKKTFFLSLLLALAGPLLPAAEAGNTVVSGAASSTQDPVTGGTSFYGVKSDTGDAAGATVVLLLAENPVPYTVQSVAGGWAEGGVARGNTVIVAGGTMDGSFHAGTPRLGDVVGGHSATRACDNQVVLVGTGPIGVQLGGASYYGAPMELGNVTGYSGNANAGNTATLDVYGTHVSAAGISNFTSIQFDLCPCLQPDMTVVTLTGDGETDLAGVDITLKPWRAKAQLERGDRVTLIHTNGTLTGVDTQAITFDKGVCTYFSGSVELSEDGRDLILTIDELSTDSITDPAGVKSVLETRGNAAALVNGGADFLVGNAIWQVRRAPAGRNARQPGGVLPFVAVGGSFLRHETGSHIKANGMNLALGMARQVNSHAIGAAYEYGFSDYDSYVDAFHASGKSKAWGAALLGDWNLGAGWHMDTIGRVGKVRSSYGASIGGPVSYNESSTYAGASIGFGYMQQAGACGAFDSYLRYLYSHLNGGNAALSGGQRAHFRGVNTNRTVLGTRYLHTLGSGTRAYAGAGWMQQYGGGAHGSVDGHGGPTPSLRGASGLFELGVQYTPSSGKGVGVDVNFTGWVGTQRGVSCGLGLHYSF